MKTIKTKEEWISVINECRASGLSARSWCRDHGISPSTFYSNVRRLRKLACDISESQSGNALDVTQEVVPLQVTDSTVCEAENSYAASALSQSFEENTSKLFIKYNGISIMCQKDSSISTICSVIQALLAEC